MKTEVRRWIELSDCPIEDAAPFDDLDGEFGGLLNEEDIAD